MFYIISHYDIFAEYSVRDFPKKDFTIGRKRKEIMTNLGFSRRFEWPPINL